MRLAITPPTPALKRLGVPTKTIQCVVIVWTKQEFLEESLRRPCHYTPMFLWQWQNSTDQKVLKVSEKMGGRLVENDTRVELVGSVIQRHDHFGISDCAVVAVLVFVLGCVCDVWHRNLQLPEFRPINLGRFDVWIGNLRMFVVKKTKDAPKVLGFQHKRVRIDKKGGLVLYKIKRSVFLHKDSEAVARNGGIIKRNVLDNNHVVSQ